MGVFLFTILRFDIQKTTHSIASYLSCYSLRVDAFDCCADINCCNARFLSLDFPGDFPAFLPLASELIFGHATRS